MRESAPKFKQFQEQVVHKYISGVGQTDRIYGALLFTDKKIQKQLITSSALRKKYT